MEETYSFLQRARTPEQTFDDLLNGFSTSVVVPPSPEPSFDELLSNFSNNQLGQGVVTRRQARLAESQAQSNVPSQNNELESNLQSQSEVQHTSELPPQSSVQPLSNVPLNDEPQSHHQGLTTAEDNLDAPFLKETLIASNDDVEAYCIKSFFRKMKNFA